MHPLPTSLRPDGQAPLPPPEEGGGEVLTRHLCGTGTDMFLPLSGGDWVRGIETKIPAVAGIGTAQLRGANGHLVMATACHPGDSRGQSWDISALSVQVQPIGDRPRVKPGATALRCSTFAKAATRHSRVALTACLPRKAPPEPCVFLRKTGYAALTTSTSSTSKTRSLPARGWLASTVTDWSSTPTTVMGSMPPSAVRAWS